MQTDRLIDRWTGKQLNYRNKSREMNKLKKYY